MLREWSHCTSKEIAKMEKDTSIVVMVAGSCEQHARHLPLNIDTFLGEAIVKRAAEKSKKTVLLLPSMPYGFSMHHMDFPGSLSATQEELSEIIQTVFSQVHHHGFQNMAVINAHGGNSAALHGALNELGSRYGMKLILAKYWDFAAEYIEAAWRESPLGGIGHAGEMETALMMHLAPEQVRSEEVKDYEIPRGGSRWYNADMFAKNAIVMYNNFNMYSPDGNVGMAQYANAEKGERLFEYCTDRLAEFFDEFWNHNQYIER